MRIVRQVEVGNGLEAWRKLHSRYEPSARGRKLGLLNCILGLCIKEQGVAVMDALNVWEQEVTKYEAKGEDLSEDIKVAVVTRSLPEPMRGHIIASLNINAATTYLQLRNRIEEFILSYKARGRKDKDRDESTAMDVSAIGKAGKDKGKGKYKAGEAQTQSQPGKGKGKDKGKTKSTASATVKFDGECHHCHK